MRRFLIALISVAIICITVVGCGEKITVEQMDDIAQQIIEKFEEDTEYHTDNIKISPSSDGRCVLIDIDEDFESDIRCLCYRVENDGRILDFQNGLYYSSFSEFTICDEAMEIVEHNKRLRSSEPTDSDGMMGTVNENNDTNGTLQSETMDKCTVLRGDWINLYIETLYQNFQSEADVCKFNIIYLDDDEIPEIIASCSKYTTKLYSYQVFDGNGRVVELDTKTYLTGSILENYIYYVPYGSIIYIQNNSSSSIDDWVWKFQTGNFQKQFNGFYDLDAGRNPLRWYCSNHQSIDNSNMDIYYDLLHESVDLSACVMVSDFECEGINSLRAILENYPENLMCSTWGENSDARNIGFPNVEDFYIDNTFDLIKYLYACGADTVSGGNGMNGYMDYHFEYNGWTVEIPTDNIQTALSESNGGDDFSKSYAERTEGPSVRKMRFLKRYDDGKADYICNIIESDIATGEFVQIYNKKGYTDNVDKAFIDILPQIFNILSLHPCDGITCPIHDSGIPHVDE